MRKLFIFFTLSLAACASKPLPGPTQYVAVDRPHAVSCVPTQLPPAPSELETKESLLAIPDGPVRYARMAADWFARVARMKDTEPVVAACQRAAPP